MTAVLINVSDDALEMIARYLSMEEKRLLLCTGDSVVIHRLKNRIYYHTFSLGDPSISDWQHLRSLKLSFDRFPTDPSRRSSYDGDIHALNQQHLVFNNLVTLQVHLIGACWMLQIGGAKLAQQFPNLTSLKFFSPFADNPYERTTFDFMFLPHLTSLKELLFSPNCDIFAYMLSSLPPSLEKLHVPCLSFSWQLRKENRLIFPSTCTLNDLYIKKLDRCGALPQSLKRLHIDDATTRDLQFNPLPKGLTSLTIDRGYINNSTLLSSHFPQSLTELATCILHDDYDSEFPGRNNQPIHRLTKLTFTYSSTYLLLPPRERDRLSPMITKLFIDCSNDHQFAFASIAHLFVNLIELSVTMTTPETADLLRSSVNRQSFYAHRHFDLPPSLRHLTLSLQHANFAEIRYGRVSATDERPELKNTIGTYFLHRSVDKKDCPLVRCTTLETLNINFHSGYTSKAREEVLLWIGGVRRKAIIQLDADMLDVVVDNIPRGLKTLKMNFFGNENVFSGNLFSKLMDKVVGLTTLSLQHISPPILFTEWSNRLSLLPRSLRHLDIRLNECDPKMIPAFPIDVLPWRLRSIRYTLRFSGHSVSRLDSKILASIVSHKNRTGKMPLPWLRTVGRHYVLHVPNNPDYDFLKTSRLEHHFVPSDLIENSLYY